MDNFGEITQCLKEVRSGAEKGRAKLLELVYREMHKMAAAHMRRERTGHTLQTTALVHEAYLKLMDRDDLQNKGHFMAVASQAMRRILVDHARAKVAAKRGGPHIRIELKDDVAIDVQRPENLLSLNSALERMAEWDERQSRIVEMRFFGGLSEAEIADTLGVSIRTVKREWAMAKAWLHAELTQPTRPQN